MAFVLMDGFDHYTKTQAAAKGWSQNFNDAMIAGRFGFQAANITAGNGRTHALPSTYSTVICGFAIYPSVTTSGANKRFYRIMAGSTNTCQIAFTNTGIITVLNSSDTTIATGSTALLATTWYYIEVKLVVNGASGTVEVHVNGATEIASTTGNFGSTNVDTIKVGDDFNCYYDDLYAVDTTGTNNNSFLGDFRVYPLYPTGAGASTQWAPTGAGSNYACVNETTPDDDTTYVSDSTVGHIDTYAFGSISTSASVFGTQTNMYARKDDAGTRQVAMVTRQGGSNTVYGTKTMASTYAFYSDLHDFDTTGSAWTPTNINGDQYGIKEIA